MPLLSRLLDALGTPGAVANARRAAEDLRRRDEQGDVLAVQLARRTGSFEAHPAGRGTVRRGRGDLAS